MTAPLRPPASASSTESGAEDALDHLVNQFADPLAFLRELVQNSIDAGSAEVEVRCEFTPAAAAPESAPAGETPGTLVIGVDDWGSGMDRRIIDHKLTRLFSSDKEGDRTQIGKFGIGFVSVFALRPDAVCVDTGRAGESWRVLFHADRSFTRIRLTEPVEGTRIQVIKAMTQGEATELAGRVKRALRFYCPHVRIELRFAGEQLSGPLSLADPDTGEQPIQVEEREPELHLVVGFTPPGQPDRAGYYNRGLTLMEEPSPLAGISFKIDSPRLAHTLSRDAIIKDKSFQQALARVQRLSSGPLLAHLAATLEAELAAAAPLARLQPLQELLATCWRRGPLPAECQARRCARSAQGELVTLRSCRSAAAAGRLFLVEQPSPLTQHLAARGILVLPSWQAELASALNEDSEPPHATHFYVLPLRAPSDAAAAEPADELRSATLLLLRGVGAELAEVVLGHLDYPGAAAPSPPAVAQDRPFELSALRDTALGATLLRRPQRTLVLNGDHAAVRSLLPLSRGEPELAAYTMAKLCLRSAPLSPELDGRLLKLALEHRCRRRSR